MLFIVYYIALKKKVTLRSEGYKLLSIVPMDDLEQIFFSKKWFSRGVILWMDKKAMIRNQGEIKLRTVKEFVTSQEKKSIVCFGRFLFFFIFLNYLKLLFFKSIYCPSCFREIVRNLFLHLFFYATSIIQLFIRLYFEVKSSILLLQ